MTGQNEPIVSGPGSFAAGDKNAVLSLSPWESEGRGGTEREREQSPKAFPGAEQRFASRRRRGSQRCSHEAP